MKFERSARHVFTFARCIEFAKAAALLIRRQEWLRAGAPSVSSSGLHAGLVRPDQRSEP